MLAPRVFATPKNICERENWSLPPEALFAAHAHGAQAAAHHVAGQAALAHLLEHLGHLGVLAEEIGLRPAPACREPAAMRLRRAPEMISWLRRSLGVMELMMASRRTNCFSSTFFEACCRPAKGPTEGIILRMRLHRAQLLDLAQLVAEVFEGEAVAEQGFLGELLAAFCGRGWIRPSR